MPKFIYAPEGAEVREWDFEPNRIPSKDAEVIEKRTGMYFGKWLEALNAGSMLAYHALLFVFLRRENPGLQWDQLEFTFADVGIKLSDAEVRDRLTELERAARRGSLSENESMLLGALRAGIEPEELVAIRAELDEEDGVNAAEDGDDDSDPTQPATAPGPPTVPEQPAIPLPKT